MVIEVVELPEGRSMSWNFDMTRSYRRTFRARTDNDKTGQLEVTSSVGIPSLGFPYATDTEVDTVARVEGYDTTQDDRDPRLWKVVVRYSPLRFAAGSPGGGGGSPGTGGAGPTERPPNPLNEPVRWRMSFSRVMKALTEDKDGKKIQNAAGVPFSPPLLIGRPIGVITATKNYASYPYSQAEAYWDKCNSSLWNGFAEKSVRVEGIDIEEQYRSDVSFVAVTWTFHWDRELWIPLKVANKGYHFKAGGRHMPFIDGGGNVVEKWLSVNGTAEGTENYLDFRAYDTVSFAGIP